MSGSLPPIQPPTSVYGVHSAFSPPPLSSYDQQVISDLARIAMLCEDGQASQGSIASFLHNSGYSGIQDLLSLTQPTLQTAIVPLLTDLQNQDYTAFQNDWLGNASQEGIASILDDNWGLTNTSLWYAPNPLFATQDCFEMLYLASTAKTPNSALADKVNAAWDAIEQSTGGMQCAVFCFVQGYSLFSPPLSLSTLCHILPPPTPPACGSYASFYQILQTLYPPN